MQTITKTVALNLTKNDPKAHQIAQRIQARSYKTINYYMQQVAAGKMTIDEAKEAAIRKLC